MAAAQGISVVQPGDLSEQQLVNWATLLDDHPALQSPFLHPAYTRCIAEVNDNVQVGVINDGGRDVGFFPHQRITGGGAIGVGARLCEFHGIIARPDLEIDMVSLLRGCGLKSWNFDHLLIRTPSLSAYEWQTSTSPYIDISEGYDAYQDLLRKRGSRQLSQTLRKARKFEREVGELRFEYQCPDDSAFDALLEWKAQQHQRTGRPAMFNYPWVVAAMQRIRKTRSDGFEGVCSVLYGADKVLAVHLGMRCGPVMHWWFPTYDPQFGSYSPGSILLVKLLQQAGEHGLERLDLGKGSERYKQSFHTGTLTIGEGMIHQQALALLARRNWHKIKMYLRSSPIGSRVEAPLRVVRRAREYMLLQGGRK